MGLYKVERLLAFCYPALIACGFVCSVTTAIAWNHWKFVLDVCVDRENCGCILNGVSTITYFRGGHIAYCHYGTFGLILSMAVALIFGSYHVFRVCISTNYQRASKHSIRQRSGDMMIMTARSEAEDENEISPHYWISATIASAVMALYTLIHAIIYLDGMWQSCYQYRNELIKYMQVTGQLVQAVQGRLSCAAVFDFMDYIHPNVSYDRARYDRIDTSWCLRLAALSTVLSFFLWVTVLFVNVREARRTSKQGLVADANKRSLQTILNR